MKKKILIIGGLKKAKSLSESLLRQGYSVTLVNDRYDDCMLLAEISGVHVIHGDGTKPFILDEAGAASCDISIALTARDEDNLVASELCKKRFGVPKTVSLVSDPDKIGFFRRMGVDSVVCALSAITNIIEQQAFIDEMTGIIPIGAGSVQIVEVQISSDSPASGRKVWESELPHDVVIGCILRGDRSIIPRGDTRMLSGDTLVLIAESEQVAAAIHVLTGR